MQTQEENTKAKRGGKKAKAVVQLVDSTSEDDEEDQEEANHGVIRDCIRVRTRSASRRG